MNSYLLFPSFRNWLKAAQNLCSSEEAAEFWLDAIGEEINSLESLLSGEGQRLGFCHNDLQYGNIMIDEETRQITLIVSSLACHVFLYKPYQFCSLNN